MSATVHRRSARLEPGPEAGGLAGLRRRARRRCGRRVVAATGRKHVAVAAVNRPHRTSASQSRVALCEHVLEHRLQVGRRAAMTRRISRGRRLLLQRLGRARGCALCSSLNSRAFSIAMTAWSANVFSSSICRSVNGPDLATRQSMMRRSAASRSSGTARSVPSRRCARSECENPYRARPDVVDMAVAG